MSGDFSGSPQFSRQLAGKTVLVVGAASGIGRAIALLAGRRGARLILADIDALGLERTRQELDIFEADVLARVLDVRRPEDVDALLHDSSSFCSGLDGAVLTAGVDERAKVLDLELADFERLLAINLTGTFVVLQAVARHMVSHGHPGSIVTFSSGMAIRGFAEGAHYASSKAGIIGLTKSFALGLAADGIRVNAIAPGAVDTPMIRTGGDFAGTRMQAAKTIPAGRIGEVDDISPVACFLLSDDSGWMTGQVLHANGGALMP